MKKARISHQHACAFNLNLATSVSWGEISACSLRLDRVLGVVRLPAGAPFLHHGDRKVPSVVAVGLNDDFSRSVQEEIGRLSRWRSRRDSGACWDAAICAMTPLRARQGTIIRRFREIALSQDCAASSLSAWAKENAFGILLRALRTTANHAGGLRPTSGAGPSDWHGG